MLTIDEKGGIFIDDVWVRLPDFEDRLDGILKEKNTSSVYIRADSAVIYASVVEVIARIKDMGIEYLGLVTSPVDSDNIPKRN